MARCPYLEYESRGALFSQVIIIANFAEKHCRKAKLITNATAITEMNTKNVLFIRTTKRCGATCI